MSYSYNTEEEHTINRKLPECNLNQKKTTEKPEGECKWVSYEASERHAEPSEPQLLSHSRPSLIST